MEKYRSLQFSETVESPSLRMKIRERFAVGHRGVFYGKKGRMHGAVVVINHYIIDDFQQERDRLIA